MKTRLKIAAASIALIAVAAQAHDGATGVVKKRMNGMAEIRKSLKVLGGMARGTLAFDALAAQEAAAEIETHAAMIPDLFEERDTSAPSEAKESLWDNFDDFTDKAAALEEAAIAAQSIDDLDALRGAVQALGGTCKSCHSDYRL